MCVGVTDWVTNTHDSIYQSIAYHLLPTEAKASLLFKIVYSSSCIAFALLNEYLTYMNEWLLLTVPFFAEMMRL